METAQKTQAKTPQPAVARRLFANACELAGGIMTTRVHAYSVSWGRHFSDPVLAMTLALGEGASMRVCMTPDMAAAFVARCTDVLGGHEVPAPVASVEPVAPAQTRKQQAKEAVRARRAANTAQAAEMLERLERDVKIGVKSLAKEAGIPLPTLITRLKALDEERYRAVSMARPKGMKGGGK